MARGVDELRLALGIAAPEDEHKARLLLAERLDDGVGEAFPAPALMGAGLMLAHGEGGVEQEHALPGPACQVAGGGQGVLLLNAILTVRSGEPASHGAIGWQPFTDAVIRCISDRLEGVVFLLWGNFARSKRELIDTSKHYVLEAAHPSPLARGAFFGCRHFSRTNEILVRQGKTPINWQL